jgi:DNA-binding MarR family transcriptional regulator
MSRPAAERALLGDERLAAWRAIVGAHARVSLALERDLLAEHGLPLSEYEVMVQLLDAPDRRLRMTDLADRVLLSRSGLTRLVDRMERDGRVLRQHCDDDGRGTYAVLTTEGTRRLRAASGTYFRGLRTHLVDPLPDDAWTEVGPALMQLAAALGVPRRGEDVVSAPPPGGTAG